MIDTNDTFEDDLRCSTSAADQKGLSWHVSFEVDESGDISKFEISKSHFPTFDTLIRFTHER